MSPEDDDYTAYVQRFKRLVGEHSPGQYGRWKSRLVPRLNEAEFEARRAAYVALGEKFNATLSNGDTIDDDLFVEIKNAETELLLERSHYLPHLEA